MCVCVHVPRVGYISTTFVVAVEVSQCYSVNSKNYCFYTSGSVLSWNGSMQFCESIHSTLPIITDEDIHKAFQQFINDAYSVIQNSDVWIGAHARPVNNSVSWHWIDRRPSGTDITIGLPRVIFSFFCKIANGHASRWCWYWYRRVPVDAYCTKTGSCIMITYFRQIVD